MDKYWCMFKKKDLSNGKTLVCVKKVKQDEPEEWDEGMPLPGDIIEGFVEEEEDDELFVPAKAKSELCSHLGKINQHSEDSWVKVRRGDRKLKLHVCIVQEKSSMLHKKFTIKAASDDRHVAVLDDLTLEECSELQEMSRRFVNVDCKGFCKTGIKYDWNNKMGNYLPDRRSTVVSSILFKPLQGEICIEATVSRCMAWFSAAVSSGAPLVFVNIQTEQIITSEKSNSTTGRDLINWSRQQKQQNQSITVQALQAVRLWFLPGITEVLLEMTPEPGEVRFGMSIKQTEEGFVFVYSVGKGTAADRAGLKHLQEEATAKGHLLIISRLEGKSLTPSSVSSDGLINCCDRTDITDTLSSAIERMEEIQLHAMAWPNHNRPASTLQATGTEAIRPSIG